MSAFRVISTAALGAVLMASCDRSVVYSDSRAFEGEIWHATDPTSFSFFVSDTVSAHEIHLNIRHSEAYPFRNLYLFVENNHPNGRLVVDTLECYLADELGRWYGRGFGSLYENKFLYRRNLIFPTSGEYRLSVHHAMRDTLLLGVADVGIVLKVTE
jgi:gliding motility-associated lipoprotein GldH